MNLDQMITYLTEAINFNTASDIYDLPRPEFASYVKRCEALVPKAAIPFCVLVMLVEERKSVLYKVKKFLKLVK